MDDDARVGVPLPQVLLWRHAGRLVAGWRSRQARARPRHGTDTPIEGQEIPTTADFPIIATTVGIGFTFAVVMPKLISGQRKKLARVEPLLRERGGMTLDAIARELGTAS
jgi:hypothetical protein